MWKFWRGVWDRLAEGLVKHEIDLALSMAMPDTEEIVAIADCRWEDAGCAVASPGHALRKRPCPDPCDTLEVPWAVAPRGTAPFEHVRQVFEAVGLGLPNIVAETRSVTALKNRVAHSGFLTWVAEPMIDAGRRAGVIQPLPIPGLISRRTLTAFRRRRGFLSSPAVKLREALRTLAA
ncbi:hypothetical protein KTE26_06675 [Ralstonia mannitolilytica]|nr:hypothetical protein [Ralstonia mannitolilytica]